MSTASSPSKEDLLPKAEAGNAEAQFTLATLFDNPDNSSPPEDLKQALYWYEKAAAQKYPKAADFAGYLLMHGMAGKIATPEGGTKVDHARAMKWLEPASKEGSAMASELIAESYFRGNGVERDTKKALKWYEIGAGQGSGQSMFRCGYFCAKGEGGASDNAQAIEWFRKGSEAGNSASFACLGAMAWAGRGMPQDFVKAKLYFERAMACRGGNTWAPYMLGIMSENGQGLPRDMKVAAQWYRKAADQRYYQAKIRCAVLHAAGMADVPDYKDDIKWLVSGAEKGNPIEQFVLGLAYLQGHFVSQSDTEAFVWLSLAGAGASLPAAEETRDVLRKKLSPEALQNAEMLIKERRAKYGAEVPLF